MSQLYVVGVTVIFIQIVMKIAQNIFFTLLLIAFVGLPIAMSQGAYGVASICGIALTICIPAVIGLDTDDVASNTNTGAR